MQMSSISPSFTSYSSNNLADIAARVVEEFRIENGDDQLDDIYNNDFYDDIGDAKADDGFFSTKKQPEHEDEDKMDLKKDQEEEEEEKEFEFAVVCNNSSLSPSPAISADEIFFNGEIVPRYPLFDQSLLLDSKDDIVSSNETKVPSKVVVRQPLSKFFNEDRDSTVSCSSSEADDIDGAAPGTYCIWKPKEELEEKCKKSNSTGNSSKRWKLRNLLSRSHSDRNFSKDDNASIVVFSPKKGGHEKAKKFEKTAKVAGAEDDEIEELTQVVNEKSDISKSNKGGNRLRSIVSFKDELVGVFANVNGLNKNLHPF